MSGWPLLATCSLGLIACQSESDAWEHGFDTQEVAYEGAVKLGGCAIGDFDPDRDGHEIAVVASSGDVLLIARVGEGWEVETIASLPGEMIQCAGGDLVRGSGADELLVVGAAQGGEDDGGPGAAWLIGKGGGEWASAKWCDSPALIHAVCIADVEPSWPGLEAATAGYAAEGLVAGGRTALSEPGPSRSFEVGDGQAKAVAYGQGRLWMACANGTLHEIVLADPGSEGQAVFAAPLARLAANEQAVVVCNNAGKLFLQLDGTSTEVGESARILDGARPLHSVQVSDDRLRGAVILATDRAAGTAELATAGYDGVISVLRFQDGEFEVVAVGRDDDKLHHLVAGTLPGLGTCLVAVGYSGRVTVVHR